MKKHLSILSLIPALTSCIGFHQHGAGAGSGFIIFLLLIVVFILAFNRVSRYSDRNSRRRNLQIVLIVAGVLLLWPLIGFILIPIIAVSMGIFFFFPPLLLVIIIVVLLLNRRDRYRD
jgi:CDP-diglyceride synthetase